LKLQPLFQTFENPASDTLENPMKGYGKGKLLIIKGSKI
jgi:hypothetical protein